MRIHTGPRRLLTAITAALALALAAGACAAPGSGGPTGQAAGEGAGVTVDITTTPTPGDSQGPGGEGPAQAPPSAGPGSTQPQPSYSQSGTGQPGTTPPTQATQPTQPSSTPPTSAQTLAACIKGKWKQQAGYWQLPGTSWGLGSATVKVNYASSTAGSTENVITFEYKADVSRYTYTEVHSSLYQQGYGNPQPGLSMGGTDYGDYSVSGSTVRFTNGTNFTMTYRMDTAAVSTKNTKRIYTEATATCTDDTLKIQNSQFYGEYRRLY